jgi:predicted DNA-binding transcriptional regulator AlpA
MAGSLAALKRSRKKRREAMQHIIDERKAAQFLGISVRTLQARRLSCKQPPFIKIGRSVRYRLDDLERFLAENRINPQAARGEAC